MLRVGPTSKDRGWLILGLKNHHREHLSAGLVGLESDPGRECQKSKEREVPHLRRLSNKTPDTGTTEVYVGPISKGY